MKYQFKLVPLDRRVGLPCFNASEVKTQFVVDIDELYRVLSRVNPISNAGPLASMVLDEQKDKSIMPEAVAEALSEMFGADVYYKQEGSSELSKKVASRWRPRR